MVVVELMVALDVVAINFLTASQASIEALKTANLLKSLPVNVMVQGKLGTGKLTLSRYILPHAIVLDASNESEIFNSLENSSEIIITHIDNFSNINLLIEKIKKSSSRVVVTSSDAINNSELIELFSVKLRLLPLSEREEDILPLMQSFVMLAQTMFKTANSVNLDTFTPDISRNAHSLKAQVFFYTLLDDVQEKDIMMIMQNYLFKNMGTKSDYRKFLHLYEVPLIKSGLKRFSSQLKLADHLGLNRNTLRKKIADHKSQFDES
jgi:DNA-binding NtrC family response regulator